MAHQCDSCGARWAHTGCIHEEDFSAMNVCPSCDSSQWFDPEEMTLIDDFEEWVRKTREEARKNGTLL